jgi:prepilin-type processing-associated H-X9-DG protein
MTFQSSTKVGIEELQESREAEQTTQYRKRRETDYRVPLVGLRDTIANPQLHRSVTTANSTATDEVDFAFGSLTQIYADQRRHGRVHDRLIRAVSIGGAHFLMVDGSVHLLNYDANPILPALASRSGGETAELP